MALVVPEAAYLEAEFAGAGMGWTDLWNTGDVRADVPVKWRYGITGNTPADRVASPGRLAFSLDNSASNSAGLFKYYSPDSASCRSGFALGIKIRLRIVYGGVSRTKFVGTLASIQPTPNSIEGPWLTHCVAFDWMDEASREKVNTVAIQLNKRSDEVFSALLAGVTRQPTATLIGTGRDTYPYSLDNSEAEGVDVMGEFQRLAMSEVGFVYVKGDGTLVFESRTDRAAKNVSLSTYTDTMYEVELSRSRDDILNSIRVVGHPRRIDAAPTTVIFNLTDTNSQVIVGSGQTTSTIVCPFTDPAQRDTRIGAMNVQALAATTDYTFNSAADGSGTDLTAQVTPTKTNGANAAFVTFTSAAAETAYCTKFQIRGAGIYNLQQILVSQDDAASQAAIGKQTYTHDMPYQSDYFVVDGAARYFKGLCASAYTNVGGIKVAANKSDAILTDVLDREPGDRITVAETQTGANGGFHIQACEYELDAGGKLDCYWDLAPASLTAMWLWGVVGASEWGVTTVYGF